MQNQENKIVVIKYGGNAMIDAALTREILTRIANLNKEGYKVVLVHGGGPFIKANLELAGIKSEFIGGLRKTDVKAMKYIEMSLKGEVNGSLVREFNSIGVKAVGLSGKDGKLAVAEKRFYYDENNTAVDLGQVGDIFEVNPELVLLLLENGYIPVIASIAAGKDGNDFNVNADNFAGSVAGGLNADQLIMLTDIDGLMMDPEDHSTLIPHLKLSEIEELQGKVIKGGMIPKIEACKYAVEKGAKNVIILNGTKPELIEAAVKNEKITGTIISK